MTELRQGPVVNEDLLLKVLDKIRFDRESWHQSAWIGEAECGTVGCLAGWTVMLSGYQPQWEHGQSAHHSSPLRRITDTVRLSGSGNPHSVSGAAKILLGLTTTERHELFAPQNTFDDLERITKDIISGESRKETWNPRPYIF